MRKHADALFTRDVNGDLLRVNVPAGAPAPRFFLGQTRDGQLLRYRGDVDQATRRTLADAAARELANDVPTTPEVYQEILAATAPIEETSAGPVFSFPGEVAARHQTMLITEREADMLRRHLSAWRDDTVTCHPMFAVVVDGAAVAVCGSVRITHEACEAGVETARSFRGRGYAASVVARWAQAIRDGGKVPLYSTAWTNDASRAVARSLGLIQFGTELHIA